MNIYAIHGKTPHKQHKNPFNEIINIIVMYKQETLFYIDTFQIHITKDYINNNPIKEIHYTIDNKIYYIKDFINNEEQRRFYFFDEELNNKNIEYYYLLTIDTFNDSTVVLYKHTDYIHNLFNPVNVNKDICTQLCTCNNEDAIKIIKNIIKNNILEKYNLSDMFKNK